MARVNYPPKTGGNASLFVPNQFPESAIPRRLVSASLFLVDRVYRLMMRWKFNSNGLVPIKAAYMRPFIGKKLPAARDALIASRVMECDFSYVAGRKSYGYLLQPGFRDCHSVECPDPRLACKIRKFREKAERRLLPVHRWLRSHLATLSVDWDIANEVMNELAPDEEFRKSVEDYRDITRESAKRIGREDLTVCAYGRVHTPFTSLPKELRRCVRTNGQTLVGIDLCNSQPLFLGLLVVRYLQQSKQAQYWTRSKVFRQRDRIRYEGPGAPPSITMALSLFETVKQGENDICSTLPKDLREYLRLCEAGKLYESLGNNRDETKRQVFLTLYGSKHCRYAAGELLKAKFPTIADLLEELKRSRYERIAWLLQHAEASFFIGQVCNRVMRERKDVPVFTIHDSVYSTPEHLGYLRDVVDSEFEKLGLHPQMTEAEGCIE